MCGNHKPASEHTVRANRAAASLLNWADDAAFTEARRGFITGIPDGITLGHGGQVIFAEEEYAFLQDDAPCPDTVQPSLWR